MSSAAKIKCLFLLLGLAFFALLDISIGSVSIPFSDITASIFGGETSEVNHIIIHQFRVPKAITAIVAGIGISLSGLLMQTFFRNPLAGPYVLGVSSGASLGAATVILLGSTAAVVFTSHWSLVVASLLGSGLVLLLMLYFANRVAHSVTLLIVGLMVASFTSAMVSVLQYFSAAEEIQSFLFWSFGSLGGNDYQSLLILSVAVLLGVVTVSFRYRELDIWLTGEFYATSMGVSVKRLRWTVILAACFMAGSITAFCGPIAFVGLAVPHLARLLFKTSSHATLLVAAGLLGAVFMLCCDLVCQLPTNESVIPINAITSLIGAPVVVSIILKKRRQLW